MDLHQDVINGTIYSENIVNAIKRSGRDSILQLNDLLISGNLNFNNADKDTIECRILITDSDFLGLLDGSGVVFTNEIYFNYSHFHKEVTFENSQFWNQVHFDSCTLTTKLNFTGAQFHFVFDLCEPVSFTNTDFNGETCFNNALFKGNISFSDANFKENTEFINAIFDDSIDIDIDIDFTKFHKSVDFSGIIFPNITYKETSFNGEVIIKSSDLSKVSGLESLPNNDALIYNNKTIFPESYSPPPKWIKRNADKIGIILAIIGIMLAIIGIITLKIMKVFFIKAYIWIKEKSSVLFNFFIKKNES